MSNVRETMKSASEWMELENSSQMRRSRFRKTNVLRISLFMDIYWIYMDINQTTICRATEVRYRVKAWGQDRAFSFGKGNRIVMNG